MNPSVPKIRFPLLGMALLTLVFGLWAALVRVGWQIPAPRGIQGLHGALMIAGLFGTLISLERAVALAGLAQKRLHWSYLAPAVSGVGAILLVFGGEWVRVAQTLLVGGSLLGLALYFPMFAHHIALHTIIMALGSVALVVGNMLWAGGQAISQAVHVWIAFLVLIIVGERLELSRIRKLTAQARRLCVLAVAVYVAGVTLTLFSLDAGIRLAGVGQIALAAWLFRYDVAGHTVRRPGLPKFVAASLLLGYAWLAVGGILGVLFGAVFAGFAYDALLHALLLGFVFSMLFGHAPIIFPAIVGRTMRFQPALYAPLALLHGSLVLRLGGDLVQLQAVRQWAGLFNVTAVALYIGLVMFTLWWPRKMVDKAERVGNWRRGRERKVE